MTITYIIAVRSCMSRLYGCDSLKENCCVFICPIRFLPCLINKLESTEHMCPMLQYYYVLSALHRIKNYNYAYITMNVATSL